jgi:hypothetical protein
MKYSGYFILIINTEVMDLNAPRFGVLYLNFNLIIKENKMLLFKVKNFNVVLFVYKHEGAYSIVSSDLEGHEGLLADGLNTLKELEDLIIKIFDSKVVCCGNFRSAEQMSKYLDVDVDLIV